MKRKTNLKVKLIGEDGNVYNLLGKVLRALKKGGYDQKFQDELVRKATSGDYNHAIATINDYVEIL